jgi:hypothetical protein
MYSSPAFLNSVTAQGAITFSSWEMFRVFTVDVLVVLQADDSNIRPIETLIKCSAKLES